MPWNFGDIYDEIGRVSGTEHAALIHAGENGAAGSVVSWPEFSARTNRLARYLQRQGLEPGAKVAHYMRNCSAYTETMVACFKGRFVHVNVNYRYIDEELHYILDNSDTETVVYAAEFRPQVEALAGRLPKVKCWLEVGASGGTIPTHGTFADYDGAVSSGDDSELSIERSGQDQLFIYTGGTTGMPKGVMWEHEAIWNAGGAGASLLAPGSSPPASPEEHAQRVAAAPLRPRMLAACPLMHGTAMLSAISVLNQGGCVVTTPETSLVPEALWNTVARYRVNNMAIVGDAFAKPLLKELDEHPEVYDISSMLGMISSGVMWSPEIKQGLLEHNENMVLLDSFGASEAVGFGASRTSKEERTARTAKFQIGEHCKVFTEDFREVKPGSGEPGFIARSGAIPLGYYKDPEKTAKTFPTIDGIRYSVPGDWCTVEVDGTLTLLGRGSVCINSGGEKIYPEEIEEVLKQHPSIDDALVVGVPDERWGQAVTGLVRLAERAVLQEEDLRVHVKSHLAPYKAPKRILEAGIALRAANGKADYKGATEFAIAALSSS
ncbi:MAG: acyl-CoA synthetase [bacterium]